MVVRPPTLLELVEMIRSLPDGPERSRLEGWYWAKVCDRHGARRAAHYRWEYTWLRRARRCPS